MNSGQENWDAKKVMEMDFHGEKDPKRQQPGQASTVAETVRKKEEEAKFTGFGNGESDDFQENIYSRATRAEGRLGAGRVRRRPEKALQNSTWEIPLSPGT